MKKKLWRILLILIIVIIITIVIACLVRFKKGKENTFNNSKYIENQINLVLSLEDEITENSAWCGTFNLIWNDLKNDLAKQDIVFTPQLDIVRNLNKGTFNTSQLSEDSYYKVYGRPTLELKNTIEDEIKRKFNETSDVLDDFNWQSSNEKDYLLYAMLKKDFEFPKSFTELDNGEFKNFQNVKYFGIDAKTSGEVKEQVRVLYYDSPEDFAIKLLTKGNDEVVIAKGNNKNNFLEAYQHIENRAVDYVNNYGETNLLEDEILKIPNININLKQEFTDLEQKPFLFSNGDTYAIEKALQTIKFELDKEGGRVKSEAAGIATYSASSMDIRIFEVDDTFDIYLVEKEKELPYFAARISDISKVQEQVSEN